MDNRWRYRLVSATGAALITALAVVVTNHPVVHNSFAQVPYFGQPAPEVLSTDELRFVTATTLVVVLASAWPLFKPRPRRVLDTLLFTQKRVLLAMVGLAALGYFNYTYRLPRTTLMLTTLTLLLALPAFMTLVRRPERSSQRAVVVGDNRETMRSLLAAAPVPVAGYVAPPAATESRTARVSADGGTAEVTGLDHLGGLARLEEVLVAEDIDTALLGFSRADREEFFGALERCHDYGVTAFVHENHASQVLRGECTDEHLREVNLEPLDWQDRLIKRRCDIAFAGTALLVLSPVIAVIVAALKLEDGGPILYRQDRTAAFGRTFTVAKFRSMRPDDEKTAPDTEEQYRVTRVGHVLRKTHFDEIPQLWAILAGRMSVVGPRAVWTDEEAIIEQQARDWRKRWFVKPGLTGLAQINDATSATPETKLQYDLEYIRKQSFWFDLKLVIRQLYQVGIDAVGFAVGRDPEETSDSVGERDNNE
jgi:lipopolysaccharide/colanic/teichoic acid biosynthesis glycosyltransferase